LINKLLPGLKKIKNKNIFLKFLDFFKPPASKNPERKKSALNLVKKGDTVL